MANSEFGYVRDFETQDALPPSNWIVVRVDGRGFSKMTKKYSFTKPNDRRALDLMNAAAVEVMRSFVDIIIAYGQSDEYSFVLDESTQLFDRRSAKLATSVATAFTAEYCMLWPKFMESIELERPWPTFDGRCVCYPKKQILRDYLSWRQADCHINNLYNTTFWALVLKGGMSGAEAEKELRGSLSKDKNEILWARFGINYNFEDEMYKKGSVVTRVLEEKAAGDEEHDLEKLNGEKQKNKVANPLSKTQLEKEKKRKMKARIVVEHVDLIGNGFWEERPYLLATSKRGQKYGE